MFCWIHGSILILIIHRPILINVMKVQLLIIFSIFEYEDAYNEMFYIFLMFTGGTENTCYLSGNIARNTSTCMCFMGSREIVND